MVAQTFYPIDIAQILAIPLPQFDMLDFVGWYLCKNGRFSVKSAYYAEWNCQYGHKITRDTIAGPSQSSPIWRKIWSLLCPAKVKIFLWRTLLGWLTCRVILVNRHIKVSGQCPACGTGANICCWIVQRQKKYGDSYNWMKSLTEHVQLILRVKLCWNTC